jgi:hypothetical protein
MIDYDEIEERNCTVCEDDTDHAVHATGWGIETICQVCGAYRTFDKEELANQV